MNCFHCGKIIQFIIPVYIDSLTLFRADTHLGTYVNSANPVQMPRNDQGLHCLLISCAI